MAFKSSNHKLHLLKATFNTLQLVISKCTNLHDFAVLEIAAINLI